MSDDHQGGHPIQMALIVVMLVGGGWYFFNHYDVDGLDGISISARNEANFGPMDEPFTFTSSVEPDSNFAINRSPRSTRAEWGDGRDWEVSGELANVASVEDPTFETDPVIFSPSDQANLAGRRNRYAPAQLRIASWALDGFGPTKLASEIARRNFVRVARQFDVIALQQVSSLHADLVPRMVDAVNESSIGGGGPIYDFVLGPATGPQDRGEQLAILFNPDRVRVDRTQTYTVADPDQQLTYDPLVAWFRAAEPNVNHAWTFSLVNVRIDLARAPSEVELLGQLMLSVREDGRGEDDVVMAGLFQADDAYLLPAIAGDAIRAGVTSTPTDIFGRHQTSNVLYDSNLTAEAIGRGGAYDFLRVYNLSMSQAQAVSSYLPVYAEFSQREGSVVAQQEISHRATLSARKPR